MEDVSELIMQHIAIYPEMEIPDLYKLLFQSTMGPGHAVHNIFSVIQFLNDEIENMQDYDDTETFEDISLDSGMFRVNLRPYLKNGGSKEKILEAFITTANTFKGKTENLILSLDAALLMSEKGMIKFDPAEFRNFISEIESNDFPAIHHSGTYRSKYKPAYRVVQKKYLV